MKIKVKTSQRDYDILIGNGLLKRISEYVSVSKIMIISDDGVPAAYQEELLKQFPQAVLHIIPQGEKSKNIDEYRLILEDLLKNSFSRKDKIIALGGGVVGDLSGFAASTYMRGIEYINIPTTTLSQIDSGIGGKTAIDLGGVKNSVGSFWQPSAVFIDPEVLKTLSKRHFSNGLVEAVKMGLIGDERLFTIFESDDYESRIDEIIERSLLLKKKIVEEDERESGLRQLLNFGHTIGHAYESHSDGLYLHGECVGMGMLKIISDEKISERLKKVLIRLNCPLYYNGSKDEVFELIRNDKKADHDFINVIEVNEIGKGEIVRKSFEQIRSIL